MTEFERVFQENRAFVFKYLMKMTRNASLAEELTQETFFRAYMNFASVRCREKVPSWLCQIAKNTYFAWYNDQKKTEPIENYQGLHDGESIEDAFCQKELSQKAMYYLHELDEPYKEVFMLAVFGGISLKEISSLFGKSESWARVTFYRAKQKLSERMKESNGM